VIRSCLTVMLLCAGPLSAANITVGSKAFTESAILGEMLTVLAEHKGHEAKHLVQLGGTGIVWEALRNGSIDVYVDYTGTIARAILKDDTIRGVDAIRSALAGEHKSVAMTNSLGFENSYEIGVNNEVAKRLGLSKISDLKQHPDLACGFSTEFMDRPEGWHGLRKKYALPQTDVTSLEHALGYRVVGGGAMDVKDVYGTDANIKQFRLQTLEDDLDFFPDYSAVILYRTDLQQRVPGYVEQLKRLEGRISTNEMIELNRMVDVREDSIRRVANNFLVDELSIGTYMPEPTSFESFVATLKRILNRTWEHLLMVAISLTMAICVAVPLGVIAAKYPATEHAILTFAEIVQTIPGLALLVLLISPLEFFGLNTVGPIPVILALFLYSLLPITRNTFTGIHDIPKSVRESATALGLTAPAQLWRVELPLASRLILAGVKTTAVINVGYATLGGLIGAGGYGQPILQGLYRNSVPKMLEGAIPAAVLAIIVKYLFEAAERLVVPKGLRLG